MGRTCRFVALATLGLIVTAYPCAADSLRYLDELGDGGSAVLEINGTKRQVAVGDEVPGRGTIVEIDSRRMVIERRLTESERTDLRSRGMMAPRVHRTLVPRNALMRALFPAAAP